MSSNKNLNMTIDLLACPICYEPLIRKGPPGLNLSSIYRSGFQCQKCKKAYSSRDVYLDLTITADSSEYIEPKPVRTELFRLEYLFKEIEINAHNNKDKDSNCKNTNEEFKVEERMAEKKEEELEYEETQGRDTQEAITEDPTHKPMIDDQEGVTLGKALEAQGKEYEEETVEMNDVTIPANANELELEVGNMQNIVMDYKKTSIEHDEEINNPIEPMTNSSLLIPTEEDLRMARFDFSRRTCPKGTKGLHVTISIKEPIMSKEKTMNEEPLIFTNEAKAKNVFGEILKFVHVDSSWTWAQTMCISIHDKRYGLDIASYDKHNLQKATTGYMLGRSSCKEAQYLVKINKKLGQFMEQHKPSLVFPVTSAIMLASKSYYPSNQAKKKHKFEEERVKCKNKNQKKTEEDEELYGEAKILYMGLEQMDWAMGMERRLGDWIMGEILIQSIAQMETLRVTLWNHIRNIVAKRKDWRQASKYFMTSKDQEKLVEYPYTLEGRKRLREAMKETLDDYKLLPSIGDDMGIWKFRPPNRILVPSQSLNSPDLIKRRGHQQTNKTQYGGGDPVVCSNREQYEQLKLLMDIFRVFAECYGGWTEERLITIHHHNKSLHPIDS
eukprot:Gb_14253 [translate_table: standard]